MARRELGEINAGSMADIAFLLLIFFLVTTTMDTDIAIERILPQKLDTPPDNNIVVKEKNVLLVKVNLNDELLVNGDLLDISKLKDKTIEFMTNPNHSVTLPTHKEVTEGVCVANIKKWEPYANANPDNTSAQDSLQRWHDRLDAVKLIGSYSELPDEAIISLQNDNWTTYGTYIKVQNELQAGINELRNDLCKEKIGVEFETLDPTIEQDKPLIKAIRMVYPQKISEATPKNIGGN